VTRRDALAPAAETSPPASQSGVSGGVAPRGSAGGEPNAGTPGQTDTGQPTPTRWPRRIRDLIASWWRPAERPDRFALPKGKTLIVIPSNAQQGVRGGGSAHDHLDAARVLGELLQRGGRRQGRGWEILSTEDSLDAEARTQNLIILCGSNRAWQDILHEFPGIMKEIGYVNGPAYQDRCFIWNRRFFQSLPGEDYGLVLVRPNPYKVDRRVIALIGLRSIGTVAAARFFAQHGVQHAEVQPGSAAHDPNLECLLRVRYSGEPPQVHSVEVVDPRAPRLQDSGEQEAVPPNRAENGKAGAFYRALDSRPRRVLVSDFVYELTYTHDYSVRFRREFTLGYAESEVAVQGLSYGSDVPAATVDTLGLSGAVLHGPGTIATAIATDEPTKKEILYFLVPPITEHDEPRRLTFTARWPQAAQKLADASESERAAFMVSRHAYQFLDKVTFRLQFEIRNAKFTVTSQTPGVDVAADARYSIGRPFEFVASNVQPGTQYSFSVRRVAV
jgi:hypothetical protein